MKSEFGMWEWEINEFGRWQSLEGRSRNAEGGKSEIGMRNLEGGKKNNLGLCVMRCWFRVSESGLPLTKCDFR